MLGLDYSGEESSVDASQRRKPWSVSSTATKRASRDAKHATAAENQSDAPAAPLGCYRRIRRILRVRDLCSLSTDAHEWTVQLQPTTSVESSRGDHRDVRATRNSSNERASTQARRCGVRVRAHLHSGQRLPGTPARTRREHAECRRQPARLATYPKVRRLLSSPHRADRDCLRVSHRAAALHTDEAWGFSSTTSSSQAPCRITLATQSNQQCP